MFGSIQTRPTPTGNAGPSTTPKDTKSSHVQEQQETPQTQSVLGSPPPTISLVSVAQNTPKDLPRNPDPEVHTAISMARKAYLAGLGATTKAAIDTQLHILTTEIDKSQTRINAETERRDALTLKITALETACTELNELKDIIETQIPTSQQDSEKHTALIARRDLLAQRYKRVGEDKLPDTHIKKAIAANTRLIADLTQKQNQSPKYVEKEIQREIRERIQNLETKKATMGASETSPSEAPEQKIFLAQKSAIPTPKKTKTLDNTPTSKAQIPTATPIKSTRLLSTIVGPIAPPPKQNMFSIRESSYKKAYKQTDPGETLQTHIAFAENYATERRSKAEKQSREIPTVVTVYDTAIHGPKNNPVTLTSLLQSDDPTKHREAHQRLQDAKSKIQASTSSDAKLSIISSELIGILNVLEKNIAKVLQSTSPVPAPQKPIPKTQHLPAALAVLSKTTTAAAIPTSSSRPEGRLDTAEKPSHDVPEAKTSQQKHVPIKPQSFTSSDLDQTKIERLPQKGLITKIKVGNTIHRYIPYITDAAANSPKNALQALFGTPKQESFSEDLIIFRCVIEDKHLAATLENLKSFTTTPPAAENFLRQALLDLASHDRNQTSGMITADNAFLKEILGIPDGVHIPPKTCQWLNDLDEPGTQPMPKRLAETFLQRITENPDRAISPNELLFIAALQNHAISVLVPQTDGTYTAKSTPSPDGELPLIIEYVHNQYQRLDPLGRQVSYSPPIGPKQVNVSAMASRSITSPQPKFGATFGEKDTDTNITCWLEAAIYSAAYDPSASLISKMTAALNQDPPAADISAEKRAFLTRYLHFLQDTKAYGHVPKIEAHDLVDSQLKTTPKKGHVTGIAALNQDVQTLYFDYLQERRIRQHDPMDFLRPLHADLDTLLGEKAGKYTRTQTLTIQSTTGWTAETPRHETYMLYTGPVKLVGPTINERGVRETVGKRVPIAITFGGLVNTDITSDMLTSESGTDSLRETADGSPRTEAVIGKTISYEASRLDEFPSECHITVSRPYNRATGGLGKTPLLTPEGSTTGTPYIRLPATIGNVQTQVRYNISQIIAHSGRQGGGHYICYFQPDPTNTPQDWYIKTSNGNPATKLPKGYADVATSLGSGNYTYTYMGVKAPPVTT